MKRKLLIAVPLLALVALLAWIFRPKPETRGEAFVSEKVAPVLSGIAQVREQVATLHYGERVDVLGKRNDYVQVRTDAGTIGWVEKRALLERRSLVVRVPLAEARAHPDDAAPLVFRAEQHVLLELAEPATGATTTATPGWVSVRHRDGQTGFVRIAQVFGL